MNGVKYFRSMDKKIGAKKFIELLEIVEKLRGPDGCPWDKEQTHQSLLQYFLEETYEVIESVDEKNWFSLEEELGDVLLHIVLQAQIAKESNKFDINNSLEAINNKLIKRHPHVFGDKNIKASVKAKQNWEEIKYKEKKRKSRIDGVPAKLPELIRSQRLQEKASYAGFDWDNVDAVWAKVHEEIDELKLAQEKGNTENIKEELGDVLFSIVNLSRFLNFSAEDMLRFANQKFKFRFQFIEKELEENGKNLEGLNQKEMDQMWKKAKKNRIENI